VVDGLLRVGQFGLQDGVVDFELSYGFLEARDLRVLFGRFDRDCFDFVVARPVFARARTGSGQVVVVAGVAHKISDARCEVSNQLD
jgi:hypothetical protein